MTKKLNDSFLNIKTTGDQRGFPDSFHHHPYEATPYAALEKLFREYPLSPEDRFVDFGCGKGRLSFVANYWFDATVTGIEMNEMFYRNALRNRDHYFEKFNKSEEKLLFHCAFAEKHQIHPLDNKFYFFNPFSIQIFITVLQKILKSGEAFERNIELILYYSSPEYFYYLEDYTPFELIKEIRLQKYESNPFERFLIYRLTA